MLTKQVFVGQPLALLSVTLISSLVHQDNLDGIIPLVWGEQKLDSLRTDLQRGHVQIHMAVLGSNW